MHLQDINNKTVCVIESFDDLFCALHYISLHLT